MLRRILLTSSILATLAGGAAAGPLADSLRKAIAPIGALSWTEEGRNDLGHERLRNPKITLEDGSALRAGVALLSTTGNGLKIELSDIQIGPMGQMGLLKADKATLTTGAAQISAIATGPRAFLDQCGFLGMDTTLEVEGFGMVIFAPDDSIDDDGRYRIQSISASQIMTGTAQDCSMTAGLKLRGYEGEPSEGGSEKIETLDLVLRMPGSVSSLAKSAGQRSTIATTISRAAKNVPGGASALAAETGKIAVSFDTISLLPLITQMLRAPVGEDDSFPRLWDAGHKLNGEFTYDFRGVTLRTANIMPPAYMRSFADAGLTTIILNEISGKGSSEAGRAEIKTTYDAVGLMQSSVDLKVQGKTFNQRERDWRAAETGGFAWLPPVKLISLDYQQTDRGFMAAMDSMLGMPVTVWLTTNLMNQADGTIEGDDRIAEIGRVMARFVAYSVRQAPAQLLLSMAADLTIPDALFVASRAPAEIPVMFDYQVRSATE